MVYKFLAEAPSQGGIIMDSWIAWFAISVIVLAFIYAIFSFYLKKMSGIFIAALFHVALGVLSLPSIGLYVLAIALLEIIVGLTVLSKFRQQDSM